MSEETKQRTRSIHVVKKNERSVHSGLCEVVITVLGISFPQHLRLNANGSREGSAHKILIVRDRFEFRMTPSNLELTAQPASFYTT